MSLSFARGVAIVIALFLSGCSNPGGEPAARASADAESAYTDLAAESCRKEVDRNDPNDTPYLVCPGVAGYSLIVRRAGSGRKSIDIVNPAQQVFPLRYDEVVTRHMSNLGGKAEWRVAAHGTPAPIALIVPVQARENITYPEKVTATYIAIAKITSSEACVTDTIADGTRSEDDLRTIADSARQRACASPKPPIAGQ